MKLKNLKPSRLIICLFICLAYPLVRYFTTEGSPLLDLINAITIISLIMIILGVLYSMILKGDFDITAYVTQRSFKKDSKPFSAYKQDKNEEREGSFNYPLFTGILLLAAAAVLTVIYNS